MADYKKHDFCTDEQGDPELQEYIGTPIPKFFWGLTAALLSWGIYYFFAYLHFVPEAIIK